MLGLSVLLATEIAVPAQVHAVNDGPNVPDDPKPEPKGPFADIQVKQHGAAKRSSPGSHTVLYTIEVKNIGQATATNVWGRFECVMHDGSTRKIQDKGQIPGFTLTPGQSKLRTVSCHDAMGNYIDQKRTEQAEIFMDAVPERRQDTLNNDVVIRTCPDACKP